MREIEFRGMDIETKEFIYGLLVQKPDVVVVDGYDRTIWEDAIQAYTPSNGEKYKFIDRVIFPYTIGQYTGRKDKNGVKIFEGDCMRVEEYVIAFVVYDESKAKFMLKLHEGVSINNFDFESFESVCFEDYEIEKCEIIGNIHQEKFNHLKGNQ